jgi:hypothetical protein
MKPVQPAVMRRSLTDAQKKSEDRYAKGEIKPTPETVSATSSTHAMFGEVGVEDPQPKKEADMTAGLKADVVRDTALPVMEDRTLINTRLQLGRPLISAKYRERHTTWV